MADKEEFTTFDKIFLAIMTAILGFGLGVSLTESTSPVHIHDDLNMIVKYNGNLFKMVPVEYKED